ncbi:hypothetical protein [Ectothiorhodospira shaposhnikovii]|uniref:hypothetical protein n=1 Tax=Ectothiorhodospira shaposhnikovii TaxID=1054 RepID=UPI001908DFB5|nr:hypothetical protein [Ectothiorhodospira shaposhnikovii]
MKHPILVALLVGNTLPVHPTYQQDCASEQLLTKPEDNFQKGSAKGLRGVGCSDRGILPEDGQDQLKVLR